jgi:hypothetical protein
MRHAADGAANAERIIAMRDERIIDSTHPFDHDGFALAT